MYICPPLISFVSHFLAVDSRELIESGVANKVLAAALPVYENLSSMKKVLKAAKAVDLKYLLSTKKKKVIVNWVVKYDLGSYYPAYAPAAKPVPKMWICNFCSFSQNDANTHPTHCSVCDTDRTKKAEKKAAVKIVDNSVLMRANTVVAPSAKLEKKSKSPKRGTSLSLRADDV